MNKKYKSCGGYTLIHTSMNHGGRRHFKPAEISLCILKALSKIELYDTHYSLKKTTKKLVLST